MKSIKPGRGPSMMGGVMNIAAVIFGIFWTITASSMGAGVFSLFGLVFIAIGIVQADYNFKNATGEQRYSAYDIVESHEEPDPLNERFGEAQSEPSPDSAKRGESRYCPYCGAAAASDHVYCSRCGKKLPQ